LTSTVSTIRVLYVIGSLNRGGAEKHLVNVLPLLNLHGITPTLYVLSSGGELAPELEASRVMIHSPWGGRYLSRMPRFIKRILGLPLTCATLLYMVFRIRPHVMHMFLPSAYLIGGMVSLLAPVPIRVMSRRSRNYYQLTHPLLALVEKFFHNRTNLLLGNSRQVVADLLAEGAARSKVRLLYNGVPVSEFGLKDRAEELRTELGIASDDLIIIIVANLIPYKRHEDLIDALKIIENEIPETWVLICVGDDRGEGRRLIRKAHAVGLASKIRWLGSRQDVTSILSVSDIGVICSSEEGFSNALLEYMATGLPTVVTNVGGNAEAVIDGICGIVVPPKDPTSLATALKKLLCDGDRRSAMGKAARNRAELHFNIDSCVEKYVSLYTALALNMPPPSLDTIELPEDTTS
jgi:glycosyltransferase involved in cell wall biosynthesis